MTSMLAGGVVLLFFLAMAAGLRVGMLSYTLLPLGLILFSIGFALNGLKAGRIFARMKELEQVSDAMGEEISRLTSTPPRA